MALSRVPGACRGSTRPSRVTNGQRPTSYCGLWGENQPTTQPTKSDILHDFRVLWQSPRSFKSLKSLIEPDSHGGSHRFESYSAHHLSMV